MLDVIQSDNGDLILKTYLIDKHFNKHDSIHPDYLSNTVQRFVGKPYVISDPAYINKLSRWVRTHPPEFEQKKGPITYFAQAQEKYRKGHIVGVERDTSDVALASQATDGDRYVAYVKITDHQAKEQYRQNPNSFPKYVSAGVYAFAVSPDNPNEITEFEPMHLAGVDYPLSGFDRAVIRGSCVGDASSCTKNLAVASVPSSQEYNQLTHKLAELTPQQKQESVDSLNRLAERYRYSSYVESRGTDSLEKLTDSTTNTNPNTSNDAQAQSTPQSTQAQVANTQQTGTTADNQSQQIQMTPNQTGYSHGTDTSNVRLTINPSGTGQPFSLKTEEIKPAAGNQSGQIGGEAKESKSKDDEIAQLRAEISKLTDTVKPLVEFKANTEKTEQERKLGEKRATIEMAIPEDYAGSPEERAKAVEALMPLGDQELSYVLQKFVVPVTGSPCAQGQTAQAGAGRGGCADRDEGSNTNTITRKKTFTRLSDYAKANVSDTNKVAQAGIQNGNDVVSRELTSRILSMTGIVNSSRLSGGWR